MNELVLLGGLAVIAFLYAMVGHGGASGYITLLTLAGVATTVVRPSALLLNVVVSAMAFVQFARAGHFRWKVFWPFIVLSIPMAWVGASATLDPEVYRKLLGVCLLFAVARLVIPTERLVGEPRPLPLAAALLIGLLIGLVSGLIGIGGGIILSPILLLMGWADARTTAATSALFILVNSVVGLLAVAQQAPVWSTMDPLWLMAAVAGGLLGSWVGSRV
ncbi:MAG TPA: sulfite exporter TauE/SafE family protein [Flavobacteriales bacterium]|nr:sulfite exporter TauE/SafE family protein [Flavobacteriales bacterium]